MCFLTACSRRLTERAMFALMFPYNTLFLLLVNAVSSEENVSFNTSRRFCFLQEEKVYSRSSRKRPPREVSKVIATRAGRLREWALVSDHMMKQLRVVACKSFQRMLVVTNSFVVITLNSFFIAYHRRGPRRYKSKNLKNMCSVFL